MRLLQSLLSAFSCSLSYLRNALVIFLSLLICQSVIVNLSERLLLLVLLLCDPLWVHKWIVFQLPCNQVSSIAKLSGFVCTFHATAAVCIPSTPMLFRIQSIHLISTAVYTLNLSLYCENELNIENKLNLSVFQKNYQIIICSLEHFGQETNEPTNS